MEPVCCSVSSSNCCFLTCIQISQEAGQVVWYSHLFQNFPQFVVTHTVKGFGIVNKAEVNVFRELCCFFDDPTDVGNLISGSSEFSKSSFNIWKFTVHIMLKSGLENFEHYLASIWDECSCAVVWAFFGIIHPDFRQMIPHMIYMDQGRGETKTRYREGHHMWFSQSTECVWEVSEGFSCISFCQNFCIELVV